MSLWLVSGSWVEAVPAGPRESHGGRLPGARRAAPGEARTGALRQAGLAAREVATWRAFRDPDRRFDGHHGKHKHEHKWLVLDAVRSFAPEEAQQALLAGGAAAAAVPPVPPPPPPPAPLIANQAFVGPPMAQTVSSIGGLSRLITIPPVPESRLDSVFTIPLPGRDTGGGGGGGGGGGIVVTPPGGGGETPPGGGNEVPPLVVPEPPIVLQLAMLSMLAGLGRWRRATVPRS